MFHSRPVQPDGDYMYSRQMLRTGERQRGLRDYRCARHKNARLRIAAYKSRMPWPHDSAHPPFDKLRTNGREALGLKCKKRAPKSPVRPEPVEGPRQSRSQILRPRHSHSWQLAQWLLVSPNKSDDRSPPCGILRCRAPRANAPRASAVNRVTPTQSSPAACWYNRKPPG